MCVSIVRTSICVWVCAKYKNVISLTLPVVCQSHWHFVGIYIYLHMCVVVFGLILSNISHAYTTNAHNKSWILAYVRVYNVGSLNLYFHVDIQIIYPPKFKKERVRIIVYLKWKDIICMYCIEINKLKYRK